MTDSTGAPQTAQAAKGSDLDRVIKLAIMAVGGQGGGVLTNWITALAERNGYAAQATSVAGVAQRTGATIYYIEMTPESERRPVFSLMPSPGDVDVLIAAELMEAGRAILRGFVTPDRTTLIASSHRMLAVSEKIAPGDGISRAEKVRAAANDAARRAVFFDMEQIAADAGTVISASLFGALAGSGVLPFEAASFEDTIRESGRGVEASLEAFAAARARAEAGGQDEETASAGAGDAPPASTGVSGPEELVAAWRELTERVNRLPEPVADIAAHGLRKVVDFQDAAYGEEYLARIDRVLKVDREAGGEDRGFALTCAAAKHVANAMAYDDVIRVADLKTRAARSARVAGEVSAREGQVLRVTEFMHPRAEELCGTLPDRLGRFVESRPALFRALDKLVNRGRRVRSDSLFGFAMLYTVAGLRRYRRGLRRHAHLGGWLDAALSSAPKNYALAVELFNNRRLVKGYSDTHARGLSKFDRVMGAAKSIEHRDDAAECVRALREAALAEESGTRLEALIREFEGAADGP